MHIISNFQKFKFAIIIKKSSAANPQQKGKWGSDWKKYNFWDYCTMW